ncbi:MAG: ferritin family protein [Candidatus Zixiibacteriota bacterium]
MYRLYFEKESSNDLNARRKIMEKTDQLLDVVKNAIRVENDGYQFYRVAEEKTKDPKGKEVFSSLAKDETNHMQILKSLYQSIKEKGKYKFDEIKDMKHILETTAESPIFSKEFKQRMEQSQFEMAALSIGILLEKNSIEFYKKSAQQSEDKDIKMLFSYLADWEGEHLRALVQQQKFLQEDYWTEARFYPF